MIDHTGLTVSDFARSKEFYVKALAPLGYTLMMEFPASETGGAFYAGFGAGKPDFWVSSGAPNDPRIHVAFAARNRATVDAFYKAALAVGGRDNGPPGIRAHYHPNYYGAFVLDPDGHNVEAVCHSPAGGAAKPKRAAKARAASKSRTAAKRRAPAKKAAQRKKR